MGIVGILVIVGAVGLFELTLADILPRLPAARHRRTPITSAAAQLQLESIRRDGPLPLSPILSRIIIT